MNQGGRAKLPHTLKIYRRYKLPHCCSMQFCDFWYDLVRHVLRNFQDNLMYRVFLHFLITWSEKNYNSRSNPYTNTKKVNGCKILKNVCILVKIYQIVHFHYPSVKNNSIFKNGNFWTPHEEFRFFQIFSDFITI